MVCAIVHVEIRGQFHGIDFSSFNLFVGCRDWQIGRLAEQVPLPGAISLAKSLFLNTVGNFFLFCATTQKVYLK